MALSHEGGPGKVGDAGNVVAAAGIDAAISPDISGGKPAAGGGDSWQEDI
jgi:hypothetical protein